MAPSGCASAHFLIPVAAILMQPLQQCQVTSGSCCLTQPSCPCLVQGVVWFRWLSCPFYPRLGLPRVTSLLPSCLQRLQVSLCSGLDVPAGKVLVNTYIQALWQLTLHAEPHLWDILQS